MARRGRRCGFGASRSKGVVWWMQCGEFYFSFLGNGIGRANGAGTRAEGVYVEWLFCGASRAMVDICLFLGWDRVEMLYDTYLLLR